jgi:GNAT superfamily N-acetyltransferase
MTTIELASNDQHQLRDEAARIWAEATAHRDRADHIASLAQVRPLIDAVLDASPRSMLILARESAGGPAMGFAAIGPEGDGAAEVRYLAVRSHSWNRGVGTALMNALPRLLAEAGLAPPSRPWPSARAPSQMPGLQPERTSGERSVGHAELINTIFHQWFTPVAPRGATRRRPRMDVSRQPRRRGAVN